MKNLIICLCVMAAVASASERPHFTSQLRDNARNYKDHDRSRHSLMLFGYGDGGGGPTKQMLEILRRAEDLQGLPRTKIRSSDEFFDLLEKDLPENDRPKMIGEGESGRRVLFKFAGFASAPGAALTLADVQAQKIEYRIELT